MMFLSQLNNNMNFIRVNEKRQSKNEKRKRFDIEVRDQI